MNSPNKKTDNNDNDKTNNNNEDNNDDDNKNDNNNNDKSDIVSSSSLTLINSSLSDSLQSLDSTQSVSVLKTCFRRIEDGCLFTSVSAVYPNDVITTTTTTTTNVEETKLSLTLSRLVRGFDAVEELSLLGCLVFKVLQSKLWMLVPREAFSGVVTMDKLRKEHKKAALGGSLVWDVVVGHLQTLVELNTNNLEYLSRCFTNLFTSDVSGEERDRLQRKVSKLLQIAMIPVQQSGSSRSPSPVVLSVRENVTTAPNNNNNDNTIKNIHNKQNYRYRDSIAFEEQEPFSFNGKKSSLLFGEERISTTSKASEFDDDEIAADEVIEKPPPLRDLDAENISRKVAAETLITNKKIADSNDEFDF